MPKALDKIQRDIIATRLLTKTPHKDIAKDAKCSLAQIRKMSVVFNRFGVVTVPNVRKAGRPHLLNHPQTHLCYAISRF
jgi:hypothetical protein